MPYETLTATQTVLVVASTASCILCIALCIKLANRAVGSMLTKIFEIPDKEEE